MPTSTATFSASLAESASPPPVYESVDEDEVSFFSLDGKAEGHIRGIGLWLYLLGLSIIALPFVDWRRDSMQALVIGFGPLGIGCCTLGYFLRRFSSKARLILWWIALIVVTIRALQFLVTLLIALSAPSQASLFAVLYGGAVWLGWPLVVLRTLGSEQSMRLCCDPFRFSTERRSVPWGFASPHFWAPLLVVPALVGLSSLAR